MDIWNNTTVYKLFVLDRNTWYHNVKTVKKQQHKKCKCKYRMNVIP